VTTRGSLALIGSACIGAGVMYLADPRMGRRRRALIHDKFVSASRRIGRFVHGAAEDTKTRIYGVYCEVKALIGGPRPIQDQPDRWKSRHLRRVS